MDGFFEILMMVAIIWVFSRGAKKRRQSRQPGADAEERGHTEERSDQKAVDWDEAIGKVLEGFGLQRPEQGTEQRTSSPEQRPGQLTSRPEQAPARPEHAPSARGAEAQRRAEWARQMEVQRAEARRGSTSTSEQHGWELRDVTAGTAAEAERDTHLARSSDLAEIAGLAEEEARRRAASSEFPASVRATRRPEAATPDAEATGAARRAGPQPSTVSGLKRLERLSELERAIIYAEILGPPKALQADEGVDW
jgi:hypothetical protein